VSNGTQQSEGHSQCMLDETLDHKLDDTAIKQAEDFAVLQVKGQKTALEEPSDEPPLLLSSEKKSGDSGFKSQALLSSVPVATPLASFEQIGCVVSRL
jgi:hypothetical protein